MRKFLKTNNYLIAEGIAAVSFYMMYKNMPYADCFFVCSLLLTAGQTAFGYAKLTNKTDKTIYCKDEHSGEIRECAPFSSIYDIDAFTVNGKVYKISNGIHMVVRENGKVHICSLLSLLLQEIKGFELETPPNKHFLPLFEKAKEHI